MSFFSHFYSLLMNTSAYVRISYLETLQLLGKIIQLSQFCVSGSRCESLILLRICQRMLNDKMLKPNETCIKRKYQFK